MYSAVLLLLLKSRSVFNVIFNWGNQLDIESIWQAYRAKLKGFLHSKVSNPDDVDDLLQEILIKIHQHVGTLNTEEKLKPWLFTIARNVIIDFYRQQGRRRDLTEDDLWYESGSILDQHPLSDCIEPIIKGLPSDVAMLLIAVDLEGKSQKKCAQELGISYSALKSRVQRGRVQLRSLFESCCHLELDRHGNVIEYQAKSTFCQRC